MSERGYGYGYVYHDHPRPFCGEGCPAYGESLLIQRYRKGSAMTPKQPATAAGRRALEWIAMTEVVDDPAGNTIYDEIRLNFIPAIEAEAAALDVDVLARALLAEGAIPMPMYRADWSARGLEAAVKAAETQARITARAIITRLEEAQR